MTVPQSRFLNPRYALWALTLFWLVLTALFAGAGVLDLHDGETWNRRGRHSSGPLFYPITTAENPKEFKAVLLFRYVMPITILGTATLVCLLGAVAQPKRSMS
jgi:hypothetical protein